MLRCLGNYKQQSDLRWIWKSCKLQKSGFFLFHKLYIFLFLNRCYFNSINSTYLAFCPKNKYKTNSSYHSDPRTCIFDLHFPRSYFDFFSNRRMSVDLPVLDRTMRVRPATRQREPITASPTLARNRGSENATICLVHI